MIIDPVILEAKRLYRLGWAVHWIKPKSKAPVKTGWSGPVRDTWETLEREYQKGYGLGVRMGEASKLPSGGYLANIDIDLKSKSQKHRDEALALVEAKYPGLLEKAPIVTTGYGLRLFVRTETPVLSGKLGASSEETVVFMPTADVNRQQHMAVTRGLLTKEQLGKGYRVRTAWEVELMSSGKQVVLPPSLHPDTGRHYAWKAANYPLDKLPLVKGNKDGDLFPTDKTAPLKEKSPVYRFKPEEVDLIGSRLSDATVDMILVGTGSSDRSEDCYFAACEMFKAGFTKNQVLSVLTDYETYLGQLGYERRHTKDRERAAAWMHDYTVVRAEQETDAKRIFADPPEVGVVAEAETSTNEEWKLKLERTGKSGDGPPKKTLMNTVLVLENAIGPDIFKRDLFALRDFYGRNAPWTGGVKGNALSDSDGVNISYWLAQHYGFDPGKNIVFDAMTVIATKNGFHPVRDELNALPPWDGVPRIDTWLAKYFEAKGPAEYLAQVLRKWMVASVTRAFIPGTKFDWMILFEGAQGTGKSSFGSILFGEDYFTDWLPALSDKDAALGLQGIRCVEFGELDQLRRNELETTKAFITRRMDKVRPPYGRHWLESRRQCVFFGTTNKEEYLKDDSGNRRFNPVVVGKLDFDALRHDREQLWAEAVFIFKNDLEDSLYLSGDADVFAKEAQNDKMIQDESVFMVAKIENFIAQELLKPETDRFNFNKFSRASLFSGMGPLRELRESGHNLSMATKALKALKGTSFKTMGNKYWKLDV